MSGARSSAGGDEWEPFAAVALQLADASGPILTRHFRQTLDIDRKADRTLVTQADREAEAAMRKIIAGAFPDHGIVGEEYGAEGADREFVWVLDPLDGTHAYIAGLATFGTLIALCCQGRPVVGVIDHPVMGERWLGVEGAETRFFGGPGKPRPARTRVCAALDQAILYATSPAMFGDAEAAAFAAVSASASMTRFGTDCYGYAMVASGHGDLVVEANMQPYDYLALAPVIEGAGGAISDWRGGSLDLGTDSFGRVIASGDARVHRAALEILAKAAPERPKQ